LLADKECFSLYVDFLNAVSEPSLRLMQQGEQQASNARIEQRSADRATAQRIAAEEEAKRVLEQKEASNARIEQQLANLATAQQAAAENEAKRVREQKEADVVAARAEAEKLKRERAEAAAMREEASKLPACSATASVEAVKAKFEVNHIALKGIDTPVDDEELPIGGTAQEPERHCQVHLQAFGQERSYRFRIRWMDDQHSEILVTPMP
jgi:ATPase subunit of ABC transporter with duplicated ATPase domains